MEKVPRTNASLEFVELRGGDNTYYNVQKIVKQANMTLLNGDEIKSFYDLKT